MRLPAIAVLLAALCAGPAAHADPACNLVTDPAGDSLLGSPSLDLVSADIATGPTTLVIVFRLRSLADIDVLAAGASWRFHYRPDNGGETVVHFTRLPGGTWADFDDGRVKIDQAAGTITLVYGRDSLPTGAVYSGLKATTSVTPLGWASAVPVDVATSASTYADQSPSCVPAS